MFYQINGKMWIKKIEMKEIKYTILNYVFVNFCDTILLRFLNRN
jgi:hypothetical protein